MLSLNMYGSSNVEGLISQNMKQNELNFSSRIAHSMNQFGNKLNYYPKKVFDSLSTQPFITPNQRFYQGPKGKAFHILSHFDEETEKKALKVIKTPSRLQFYLAVCTLVLPLLDIIGCTFKRLAAFDETVCIKQTKLKELSDYQKKIKKLEETYEAAQQIEKIINVFSNKNKKQDVFVERVNKFQEETSSSLALIFSNVMSDFHDQLKIFFTNRIYTSNSYLLEKDLNDQSNLYEVFGINAFSMKCKLSQTGLNPYDFFRDRCDGILEDQQLRKFMGDYMPKLTDLIARDSEKLKQKIDVLLKSF